MIDLELQHEIIDLLKQLIRIPSTASRPEEIQRCADFICNWLTANGIDFLRKEHNSVPSIVIMPQSGKSKVLLVSHFDVVEVDHISQFEPLEKNGLLYGRGSIDDKYGVAVSLILFREHLKRLQKNMLSQDDICFGLLLTGDEETGGRNGAGASAEHLETEYFIALDGGSPAHIVTKEKGVIAMRLEATGKAAHAARPWLGQNAFDTLVEDYLRITNLFRETSSEDHWHRTVVLANCHAGNGSTNIVPELATATLNIRYTEHDDPDELIESIRSSCRSEVFLDSVDPVFDSGPSPYLDRLVRHSQGAAVGFEHGASDAKFFSERNIPGAIWGANGNMSQHTESEHVEIESVFRVYEGLAGFLDEVQDESGGGRNLQAPIRPCRNPDQDRAPLYSPGK